MKKLFNVTIDNEIYIMAENYREAISIAEHNANSSNFWAIELPDNRINLISDWENRVPYNSDDKKTCGEIMREIKNREEINKK